MYVYTVIRAIHEMSGRLSGLEHRKSPLARGSRWDYTPLPF